MTGFLDDIADEIYDGFAGEMKPAILFKRSVAPTKTFDSLGDETSPTPGSYPCEGFRDDYTLAFKLAAGLPESDAKICIFGASLPDGIRPEIDDCVSIDGQWFQLRKGKTDPGDALWESPGYEIKDPTV